MCYYQQHVTEILEVKVLMCHSGPFSVHYIMIIFDLLTWKQHCKYMHLGILILNNLYIFLYITS